MAPTTLGALASKIRSKNAGPFWVTIEVFLPDDEAFTRAGAEPCLTAERIASIYGAAPGMVKTFRIPGQCTARPDRAARPALNRARGGRRG